MADPAPSWVLNALQECGRSPSPGNARRLGGGVSADVFLVGSGANRWVVKRPRERFQVADEWSVGVERARVEAEATRWFMQELPPGSVASLGGLVDDDEVPVLVFEAAPADWRPWKEDLLAGRVRVGLAREAGALLARIHASGSRLPEGALRNDRLFEAQRIAPYLRTSAHRVPPARGALKRLQDRFFNHNDLVHGDFTPKNLLVDPADDRLILIDHEVVTRGDAAFDVASLWNHLALKAVNRKDDAQAYLTCAQAAREGYLDRADDREQQIERTHRALDWVPALLLARAVGKSPVEYLSTPDRARIVRSVIPLLDEAPSSIEALWDALPLE